MKTEFENVPSPYQKQYIFVEKNEDKKLSKIHVLNFICTGETPLSIETTSDSLHKIQTKTENINISFTTNSDFLQETFDFFTKLYKDKTQKELNKPLACCTEYHAPRILTDTSINAFAGVERTIASSFMTMASAVPNSCSKDFINWVGKIGSYSPLMFLEKLMISLPKSSMTDIELLSGLISILFSMKG
jgi:hypothetical protein